MREELEKLLADMGAARREAEAEAGHAAEQLARLAAGFTPLEETDHEQLRAAADTFSDAVARLKQIKRFAHDLRRILM